MLINNLHETELIMIKYSVGIDVSAATLAWCLSTIDHQQHVKVLATGTVSNTTDGFKGLIRSVQAQRKDKHVPLVWLMEATGVYYENCALWLTKAGEYVSVVLANKSKKYMESLGLKSKNDSIDARGLARMGAEQSLPRWQPMSEFFFTLRTMTRQYESLQGTRTTISNQLHAAEHSIYQVGMVTKQLKALIKTLDKQIKDLHRAIVEHLNSDPVMAEKVRYMCSIKGVGVMSVAVILAETNGFALIRSIGQLVSYCGYDVVEDQSGNRVGATRISKRGNPRIRRMLYFPAITAVHRGVKPLQDLFDRTYDTHRIKMKSYVAVQKKLLILIYTLWKKNKPFIDGYGTHKTQENEPFYLTKNGIKKKKVPRQRQGTTR